MKILLTKASDWKYKKIIEVNDIMELKSFGENSNGEFIIDFDFMKYMDEEEEEKYKGCSFEAMIYDNYIE